MPCRVCLVPESPAAALSCAAPGDSLLSEPGGIRDACLCRGIRSRVERKNPGAARCRASADDPAVPRARRSRLGRGPGGRALAGAREPCLGPPRPRNPAARRRGSHACGNGRRPGFERRPGARGGFPAGRSRSARSPGHAELRAARRGLRRSGGPPGLPRRRRCRASRRRARRRRNARRQRAERRERFRRLAPLRGFLRPSGRTLEGQRSFGALERGAGLRRHRRRHERSRRLLEPPAPAHADRRDRPGSGFRGRGEAALALPLRARRLGDFGPVRSGALPGRRDLAGSASRVLRAGSALACPRARHRRPTDAACGRSPARART